MSIITQVYFNMYWLQFSLLIAIGMAAHHRKNVALVSRHRQAQASTNKIVPTPDATLTNLNNLETKIRQWPEGGIGGTTTSTDSVGSSTASAVDSLNANLRELTTWSNDGMAKLMGSTSSQEVSLGVLRAQFDQFRNDTTRSLTRIKDALQNLGAEAADGSAQSANSLQTRLKTIQTQLDKLSSASNNASSFSLQLSTAQQAIVAMNDRVSAMEDYTGINRVTAAGAQSAESSSSFDSEYLGFDFMIQSWTGRFAIIGVGLGLIALILAIVALVMLPKKPAVPKGEEQVLLEAGGEDPNAEAGEADPNAEGYDPNAEQYYYQEGAEGQQQEEVPAT